MEEHTSEMRLTSHFSIHTLFLSSDLAPVLDVIAVRPASFDQNVIIWREKSVVNLVSEVCQTTSICWVEVFLHASPTDFHTTSTAVGPDRVILWRNDPSIFDKFLGFDWLSHEINKSWPDLNRETSSGRNVMMLDSYWCIEVCDITFFDRAPPTSNQ